tara:strand:- start:808 stop:1014 length:207 start_codon:yes stop_codon:yes gene_type:complete
MVYELPTQSEKYNYKHYSFGREGCNNLNTMWGSQNPIKEECIPYKLEGKPCTNIWNNNTKRKIIVNKQ